MASLNDLIPEYIGPNKPNPKRQFPLSQALDIVEEARKLGLYDLYGQGLCKDESNFRIHVCFFEGYVYTFPTQELKKILCAARVDEITWPAYFIYLRGIRYPCALGVTVPIMEIPSFDCIEIPGEVAELFSLDPNERDEGVKGDLAEAVAGIMLQRRDIQIPISVEPIKDKAQQLRGRDFVVRAKDTFYEVKCDAPGGIHGGTKNLFIQIMERRANAGE